MSNQLGIMVAGLGGAISGTLVSGVELMRRGFSERIGIMTEGERIPTETGMRAHETSDLPLLRDALRMADLDDIVFSGWDVHDLSLLECTRRDKTVPGFMLEQVADYLGKLTPLPGIVFRDGFQWAGKERITSLKKAVDQLRRDISNFRTQNNLEHVVIVNVMPTTPPIDEHLSHYHDLKEFEKKLEAVDLSITPSMLYFYAAAKEGCGHINFTPNNTEVPALRQLARESGMPFCGKDGKTGQTFIKTVLAPAFRSRQLRVRGWFSTNILGNADGKALSDPTACKTKLISKASVLENILGYPVTSANGESSHVVTIHYYPTRGDAKEAWDNIDLLGFLGAQMQMKVNFLCKDSILAAPLLIDLSRFLQVALRRKESGIQKHLGIFFKSPVTKEGEETIHDFFIQEQQLVQYIRGCLEDQR